MNKKKTIEEITISGIAVMAEPENIKDSMIYINERTKFLEWFNQIDDKEWERHFLNIIISLNSNRNELADQFQERTISNLQNNHIETEEESQLRFKKIIENKRNNDICLYKLALGRFKDSEHSREYNRKVAKEVVHQCNFLEANAKSKIKVINFESQTKESIIIETLFDRFKNVKQITSDKKLTIPKIALKLVYEERSINRREAKSIVIDYGYNSGDRLYQKFCFYLSRANRKGKPDPYTKRTLLNKINLLNSVIDIIPEQYKSKAIDEVKILETFLENDFK